VHEDGHDEYGEAVADFDDDFREDLVDEDGTDRQIEPQHDADVEH
jgi:hypothetical protein